MWDSHGGGPTAAGGAGGRSRASSGARRGSERRATRKRSTLCRSLTSGFRSSFFTCVDPHLGHAPVPISLSRIPGANKPRSGLNTRSSFLVPVWDTPFLNPKVIPVLTLVAESFQAARNLHRVLEQPPAQRALELRMRLHCRGLHPQSFSLICEKRPANHNQTARPHYYITQCTSMRHACPYVCLHMYANVGMYGSVHVYACMNVCMTLCMCMSS